MNRLKKMHKIGFLLLMAILMSTMTFAQRGERKMSEERAQKMMDRIVNKLELTEQEQAQFVPMYKDYLREKAAVWSATDKKDRKKMSELSDREVEEIIEGSLKREQELLNIKKSYVDKFKSIMPAQKVAKLLLAEKRWKGKMYEKMKNKRGHKRKGRQGQERLKD